MKSLSFLTIALTAAVGLVAPIAAQADASQPAPKLKVTNAGDGPKAQLRYAFKKGQKAKLTVASDMRMSMAVGDKSMPPMSLPTVTQTLKADVTGVAANGDTTLRLEIVKAAVTGQGPDELVDQLKKEMDALAGAKVTLVFSTRGSQISSDIAPGPKASPQSTEMLDGVLGAIKQLIPYLPEEEVGAGATWEVAQPVAAKFGTVSQTAKYKLKGAKGDKMDVEWSIAQSAKSQKVPVPGAPPGTTATLKSLEGKGTGSGQLGLKKLGLAGDSSADVQLVMNTQGQDLKMGMSTAMKVK
ncbi:MAG: hypothetical protein R3A78_01140 [Polyangiales bacterium]